MKLPFERTACFALGVMLTVAATAPAKAQTPIHFAGGSDTGAWAGYVNATKDFSLGMGKGQRLWVQSDDIYTCKLVAPSGRTNDCRTEQGVVLPESGTYKVKTAYRMDGGSSRYVSIQFTVR